LTIVLSPWHVKTMTLRELALATTAAGGLLPAVVHLGDQPPVASIVATACAFGLCVSIWRRIPRLPMSLLREGSSGDRLWRGLWFFGIFGLALTMSEGGAQLATMVAACLSSCPTG
jgi:hypothetical protein